MVSRSLPFWQLIWSAEAYPSYIERAWYLHMIHHLQSVSPDCFWSIISPHESSATVTLPRLFRSHISTTIMTKNAPMQRKFNFGEDETIRSAFTASPEDDARPKLVVKKRECYPDPVRHVCQVRIIIWKIYTSVQEFHHPQPGTNVNNNQAIASANQNIPCLGVSKQQHKLQTT